MTKQEFLAMSLGKGLILQSPYGFRPNCKESTGISRLVYLTGDLYADIENKTFPEEFIPICHPLSDLTKPITHKGETFVPIVELAKLANFNTNNIEYIEFIEGDYRIICDNGDDERLFGYTLNGNVFINWIFPKHKSMIEKRVENQLDLFLKLIKWHFDLAGLIEKGEAIDINTLNENPYE